ncbi:MAG: type II toxin-antitoxin system VapC family toxin, partial [Candidatus Hydrothermarchaeota archaeon]|nr:type II toxin-antitoxin system VapC family toxin [Candidatus Hydrothermarchaeota archaeon]
MRIYLDTSAFVKRYSSEEGSSTINSLFESEHEIVTSHWTLTEAIAAIDKKVRRRQITETERDLSISVLFSDILEKNITFIKLSDEFLYPIIEKILAHHISADDALQLFSCIV